MNGKFAKALRWAAKHEIKNKIDFIIINQPLWARIKIAARIIFGKKYGKKI